MLYSFPFPLLRLRSILCLGLWLCIWGPGGANAAEVMQGLDSKKVAISLEASFLDEVPERGTLPLYFQIQNKSGSPGQWTFRFTGIQGWNNQKQLSSERTVTVDARSTKNLRWNIPVFPNSEFHNGQDVHLEVSISGPGASGVQQRLLHGNSGYYGDETPVVAISPELRITRDHWNYAAFENEFGNRNSSIRLLGMDPAVFPVDVSGLSGVDVLLMTRREWEGFRLQQALIKRWIAGGGQLWLISEAAEEAQVIGMGTLKSIPYLQPKALVELLDRTPTIAHTLWSDQAFTRKKWELAGKIPTIQNSFGWFMLTVLLIAALLGPVNVWLSFRRKKSMQVLWTTPLISLALSLLVAVGIIFSDGFGGKGARSLYVLLVPEQGVEVLVQEQISRTGVLLNDRFSLPEDTEMYMVNSGKSRDSRRLAYTQHADGSWSGDWFENRNIQAQVIRRNRSSRAEVVFKAGAAPTVLSSVDATFSRIMVRDGEGALWLAEQVAPGRETPLRKANKQDVNKLFDDLSTRDEMLFPDKRALNEKGWFYAESMEKERYLDSLPAISWEDQPLWYMGPVTMEEQP